MLLSSSKQENCTATRSLAAIIQIKDSSHSFVNELLGGFDRRNYTREETIQGRKLYEELRFATRADMCCFLVQNKKIVQQLVVLLR